MAMAMTMMTMMRRSQRSVVMKYGRRRSLLTRSRRTTGFVRTRRKWLTIDRAACRHRSLCSQSSKRRRDQPTGPIPKKSEPEGLASALLKAAIGVVSLAMGSRVLLLAARGAPLMAIWLTPAGIATACAGVGAFGVMTFVVYRKGWIRYHRSMLPLGAGGLLVTIVLSVIIRDMGQSYHQELRRMALDELRDREGHGVVHEIDFELLSADGFVFGSQTLFARLRARHTSKTDLRPRLVDYEVTAIRDHSFQSWRLTSLNETNVTLSKLHN